MGSELGTRVANLLEVDRSIEIVGVDSDPPRRRVRHADFHRVDPLDRARMRALIREVDPTELVHLGVFEPNARVGATTAATWTDAVAAATFDTLERLGGSVERIVVRSGIEVYGRRRGSPLRPDETVPRSPTSPFGRTLALLERRAVEAGRVLDVPVTLLRCGPIVGSHLASPLGRYLRLPVVPFGVFDAPFSLAAHGGRGPGGRRRARCGSRRSGQRRRPGCGDRVPGREDRRPHPDPGHRAGMDGGPTHRRAARRPAARPRARAAGAGPFGRRLPAAGLRSASSPSAPPRTSCASSTSGASWPT